jgi:hypothetical protein
MLAEATTIELSKARQPEIFAESREVAHEGGAVACNARRDIEEKSDRPVITEKKAIDFTGLIEAVMYQNEKDEP